MNSFFMFTVYVASFLLLFNLVICYRIILYQYKWITRGGYFKILFANARQK